MLLDFELSVSEEGSWLETKRIGKDRVTTKKREERSIYSEKQSEKRIRADCVKKKETPWERRREKGKKKNPNFWSIFQVLGCLLSNVKLVLGISSSEKTRVVTLKPAMLMCLLGRENKCFSNCASFPVTSISGRLRLPILIADDVMENIGLIILVSETRT
ncbi:uncharacterized protein VSU04_006691 [Chlamydotis macqueenii]